ncbi:glycerate kinase [Clostridium sp. JN-9]|nr:glycerate kinase [Clostridium sp. JN-9]
MKTKFIIAPDSFKKSLNAFEARYGLIIKENTVVIETASACGLQLVRM